MPPEQSPRNPDNLEELRAAHHAEIERASAVNHELLSQAYHILRDPKEIADDHSTLPITLRPATPHFAALLLYPNGDLRIMTNEFYQGNSQDRILDGVEYNLTATRELLRLAKFAAENPLK